MKINEVLINSIDVRYEFGEMGVGWKPQSDDEISILCPFHNDSSPSCFVNTRKKEFKCHAAQCNKAGDILTLIAAIRKTTRFLLTAELINKYQLDDVKEIEMSRVEKYHQRIWENPGLLKALYERGVTDDAIRKYRLGEYDGRIIIPIFNKYSAVVNLRKYLPGAPPQTKMKNERGRGQNRLFPVNQPSQYDTVIICGGEIKAIVTATFMNPLGFGAVTTTGGEGSWHESFTQHFQNKRVYVCFDIDRGGIQASEKICTLLYQVAKSVAKVQLPLDIDKYPKGDINDYFGREGKTAEDFLKLLTETPEWKPDLEKKFKLCEDPPESIDFHETLSTEHVGKRVQFEAVVSTVDSTPYMIPKTVLPVCDRKQDICGLCPVFGTERGTVLDIPTEHPEILRMLGASKDVLRNCVKETLGVPTLCKVVEFETKTFSSIEDAKLVAKLEIDTREVNNVVLPAKCCGGGIEGNITYALTGRVFPDPRTQQSVALISDWIPTNDALANYTLSSDDLEKLKIFVPDEWTVEGIEKKLDHLYSDLEANVTRIYGRRDMHIAVDLTYHSALMMYLDGRSEKAWVEILIVGDSSQGKSYVCNNLMRYYNLGEKVDCKSASVAGLLGGVQKDGNRNFITWGIIPLQDKRLVVLEELKGAAVEVICKLTEMRSSGIADIGKIEKRRTHARTRLVAISNPRADRTTISSYNYGVDALSELIGSLEDLRRFDLCLVIAAEQISKKDFSKYLEYRPEVENIYTDEICRRLILWTWSRLEEQVIVSPEIFKVILEVANGLTMSFSEQVPIVDKGSMRLKVARLAVALAARTFSTTEDLRGIEVRECHVRFIDKLLRRIYCDRYFGYDDYTKSQERANSITDVGTLKNRLKTTKFPTDFAESLLFADRLDVGDIRDWGEWEFKEAQSFLSLCVRKHALIRDKGSQYYRKSSQFTAILKEMLRTNELDRPSFIPQKEEPKGDKF